MNYEVRTGYLGRCWNHNSFTDSKLTEDGRNVFWFKSIEKVFGLMKQYSRVHKLLPDECITTEKSTYAEYLNEHTDSELSSLCSVILMLHPHTAGQCLSFGDTVIDQWQEGDWFLLGSSIEYSLSNISSTTLYSLIITGQVIYTGQLKDLFCFNIPDVKESNKSSHPIMMDVILPKVQTNTPLMIYMDNRYIDQLDDIKHDSDVISYLNSSGINIHLYEPLCSYIDASDIQYNRSFYSEFAGDVPPNSMRAAELDSIMAYAKRNNLTNITVHTCDYRVKEWYPYYEPAMNLVTNDLFLKCQLLAQDSTVLTPNFTKKFMCLNWRHTKHRQLISTFLCKYTSHLSWYFKSSFDVLSQDLFFDMASWEELYPELYNQLLDNTEYINEAGPFYIDKPVENSVWIDNPHFFNMWPAITTVIPSSSPALNNSQTPPLAEYYSDIFVDIINETRFAQPTGNFSEKVFQAIGYMKPFIVVAPPNTLEYIKSFGYRTFDEYWDESYDTELDHGKRMAKILLIIKEINNRKLSELQSMYASMTLILDHNYNLLKHSAHK